MGHFLKRIEIISLTYGLIGKVRRALYRKGIISSKKFETTTTISIGNLSMGGTGKTPHVELLISRLSDKYKIAVLSRGYGRKSKGYISTKGAQQQLTAALIGDEPLQIHKKFPEIEVAVCEKRKDGIENLLLSQNPPDLIILDDAYQHLQVTPDCQILLTEYSRPYFEDFVVPAGRLREFASAAKYADIIVVTKSPASLTSEERSAFIKKLNPSKGQDIFFSTITYDSPIPVSETARETALSPSTPVKLITGIANPEPLLTHISERYKQVKHFKFRDHHTFTEKEIEQVINHEFDGNGSQSVIFTTEKDISRLMPDNTKKFISLQPIFAIPVEMQILFGEEEKLINKIERYVTKNQRKRRIPEK